MKKITSPTLLLDREKCLKNISEMAEKAEKHNLKFKPHVKTHQSAEIGSWFRDAGVDAVTVSSITMAEYFAGNDWDDITIAFPCNVLEMERLNILASSVKLSLLLSDEVTAKILAAQLNHTVQVYIEIDTGSGRTGLRVDQPEAIESLLNILQDSSKMTLKGFYSHPGHSYSARSEEEIIRTHRSVLQQIEKLRNRFKIDAVCIGDTPCCSVADRFDGIDEISPGNFVFYDLMQAQIGSCRWRDIAVALACPVVASFPGRKEVAVHAGAVHLSKESLTHTQGENQLHHFGFPVILEPGGWSEPLEGCHLKAISQEHGILSCSDSFFPGISIGDVIGILPVHSCLTANLMMGYTTLEGEKLNHLRASGT